MLSIITGLITACISAWSERSKQKSELKSVDLKNKFRLKQAQIDSQIKRVEQADGSAISMDQLSFKNRGWKDEFLLLFTTAPVIILFIAPLLELALPESSGTGELTSAVMAGFAALQKTPDWYLVALLLVYVDTFGFRRLLRGVIESKLGRLSVSK